MVRPREGDDLNVGCFFFGHVLIDVGYAVGAVTFGDAFTVVAAAFDGACVEVVVRVGIVLFIISICVGSGSGRSGRRSCSSTRLLVIAMVPALHAADAAAATLIIDLDNIVIRMERHAMMRRRITSSLHTRRMSTRMVKCGCIGIGGDPVVVASAFLAIVHRFGAVEWKRMMGFELAYSCC